MKFIYIAALFFTSNLHADLKCKDTTRVQCDRARIVVEKWTEREVEIVWKERLSDRGSSGFACVYDAESQKIFIEQRAFDSSDEFFLNCLASAYSAMRFLEVEDEWRKHLGVKSSVTVSNGKANLDDQAFIVWQSLATHELVAAAQGASGIIPERFFAFKGVETMQARTIASALSGVSTAMAPAVIPASDQNVSKMLGLKAQ